ncbi:hypothetical protein, partial [Mesorhizobium sp. P5_C1]
PSVYKTAALPAELQGHGAPVSIFVAPVKTKLHFRLPGIEWTAGEGHPEKRQIASYISGRCNRFEQGCRMIRFVIILPIILVVWMLLVKIISDVKKANVDWTGVTTIIGFIALAFWLRHVTGMG